MFGRKDVNIERLTSTIESLSVQVAELRGSHSVLDYEQKLNDLHERKTELEIELAQVKEAHAREEREIEHKLGLHRKQIESERSIMVKEAEAERLGAVEEAKLAVREENLGAERKRFEQEIEFRTQRFEAEAETLRNLTEQILERLPKVSVERTFRTVEHVGNGAAELEAGDA